MILPTPDIRIVLVLTFRNLFRMQVYHLFGWFWLMNFIIAFGQCVLAGAFASWYWAWDKKTVSIISLLRLMTMSPLYPCGKPYSRGTHNETVKDLALFLQSSMELRKNHGFESPSCGNVFNSSIESKILSHLHLNNSNSQISQSDWYWRNCEVWAQIGPSFS